MNQLMQKVKRSSPRKGRRSTSGVTDSGAGREDESRFGLDDSGILSTGHGLEGDGNMTAPPKPPRRKTGGWADSLAKSAKSKINLMTEYDEENELGEKEKDIMTIPDLDDFQEEDFAAQVAKAPNVAVNRVATYRELDSDLLKQSTFSTLDNIDLKLLTKYLAAESEIQEDDLPWTWDMLMAEVSTKLNTEADTSEDS